MIGCALFGHKPSEMVEYMRYGAHRTTYCERCGEFVTHAVPVERPLPPNHGTLATLAHMAAQETAAMLAPLNDAPACWHDRERPKRAAKPAPVSEE